MRADPHLYGNIMNAGELVAEAARAKLLEAAVCVDTDGGFEFTNEAAQQDGDSPWQCDLPEELARYEWSTEYMGRCVAR